MSVTRLNVLQVHYENNRPFLEITRLHRTLELSMWGNIAVEETVDVRHVGAKLKGSFSRLDFQRENSGVSAVKSFKTVLPASASGVYYRDDIGNISTSALRVLDDSVEVELRPRFPLFGGWKVLHKGTRTKRNAINRIFSTIFPRFRQVNLLSELTVFPP